jgi:hypothetical protein
MDAICDQFAQATITDDKYDVIVQKVTNEIITYYEKCWNENEQLCMKDNTGGQIRSKRGDMVEMIAEQAWNSICDMLNVQHLVACKKGTKDYLRIVSPNGFVKMHQTDRHHYFNDKIVLVTECKSYLDSCYYERACMDFKIFKQHDEDIKCIILSLEESMNIDTQNFYNDIFNNCVDRVFYLCKGKRSSSKPIYKKEFKKNLDNILVSNYVKHLLNVILQLQSQHKASHE